MLMILILISQASRGCGPDSRTTSRSSHSALPEFIWPDLRVHRVSVSARIEVETCCEISDFGRGGMSHDDRSGPAGESDRRTSTSSAAVPAAWSSDEEHGLDGVNVA